MSRSAARSTLSSSSAASDVYQGQSPHTAAELAISGAECAKMHSFMPRFTKPPSCKPTFGPLLGASADTLDLSKDVKHMLALITAGTNGYTKSPEASQSNDLDSLWKR